MYPRSFFVILSVFFGGLSVLSGVESKSKYNNYNIYKKSGYETEADIIEYSEYADGRKKYSRLRIKYYNGENDTENIIVVSRKKGLKYKSSACCPVVCIKGRKSIIDILNNGLFDNKFLNEGFIETIDKSRKFLYKSKLNDGSVYLKEDSHFLSSAIFDTVCSVVAALISLITFLHYFEFFKYWI